jgi:5-methylcytosine-specific restriction endonuclease McrA
MGEIKLTYYERNKEKVLQYRKEYQKNNKEKEAQRKKEWRANNKEKISQRQKEYRENNKEKVLQKRKEYLTNNKDKIAQRKKEYRTNNKDKESQWQKEYYKNNKDKLLQKRKEYLTNNKEKCNYFAMARRQRKKQVNEHLPRNIRTIVYNKFNHQCFNCSSQNNLHIDHHFPLSKGFALTITNAALLCKSCNSSKGAKLPEEFYTKKQLNDLELNYGISKSSFQEKQPSLFKYLK